MERSAELTSQRFELPPGGNRVTSYLDIFAREGTRTAELARAVVVARSGPDPTSFPAVMASPGVVLRLGMVFGLVPSWRTELTELASRLILSAEELP